MAATKTEFVVFRQAVFWDLCHGRYAIPNFLSISSSEWPLVSG